MQALVPLDCLTSANPRPPAICNKFRCGQAVCGEEGGFTPDIDPLQPARCLVSIGPGQNAYVGRAIVGQAVVGDKGGNEYVESAPVLGNGYSRPLVPL